ncbi:hypothetical protein K2173_010998 [Erythroxylum novogranatense]|uniref:Pentatricopeptide repeat-containing protein n=1 Tax=Erythroxylum novogranatense TaxID=1862640 RepID=A0AAV8T0F4_9ROSI|nr:hypothetical protein K2173_010998 [Erythroxylum novogranatense]
MKVMWRSAAMLSLLNRARAAVTMPKAQLSTDSTLKTLPFVKEQSDHHSASKSSDKDAFDKQRHEIGKHVSGRAKVDILLKTLSGLDDSKEAVYGSLDAWVAWEQKFPTVLLKNALIDLEKEHQWHKIIQVIKWMLSKGQGNTLGTYEQLIVALDMDHRAEEAHMFWVKKIGNDLHSVSWQLCKCMMGIYYRNNMLEHLIKLFKGLEAFNRNPPEKQIVRKVANAYEMLGMLEEKDHVLEKYNHLFVKSKKKKKPVIVACPGK